MFSLTVALKVVLGGGNKLDSNELEATMGVSISMFWYSSRVDECLPSVLEAGDDGANKATLRYGQYGEESDIASKYRGINLPERRQA